jgi:hypothetical protein
MPRQRREVNKLLGLIRQTKVYRTLRPDLGSGAARTDRRASLGRNLLRLGAPIFQDIDGFLNAGVNPVGVQSVLG